MKMMKCFKSTFSFLLFVPNAPSSSSFSTEESCACDHGVALFQNAYFRNSLDSYCKRNLSFPHFHNMSFHIGLGAGKPSKPCLLVAPRPEEAAIINEALAEGQNVSSKDHPM